MNSDHCVQAIMTDDSDPHMFLIFFLTLAGCTLLSLPVTWWVSETRRGVAQLTLSSLPENVRAVADNVKPFGISSANINKGFDTVE